MKSFKLKQFSRTKRLLTAIPSIILAIVILLYFFDIQNLGKGNTGMIMVLILVAIPFIFVWVAEYFLKEIFDISISDHKIVILKNNLPLLDVPIKHLSMILLKDNTAQTISLYQHKEILLKIESMPNQKGYDSTYDVLEAIIEGQNFIKANEKLVKGNLGSYTVEYINNDAISSSENVVQNIRKEVKNKSSKFKFIAIGLCLLLIFLSIVPHFINPKAFYDVEGNKVYFGKHEMEGVNANEFTTISYNVAKDSSKIYFRGNEVDVDYKSFKMIKTHQFYLDKNRIYYETNSFYSKNKLAVLEDDYDIETFENIDNTSYFRDKNALYKLNFWTVKLEKQEPIAGLNYKALQCVDFSSIWLKDDHMIYFMGNGELTPRPDIDFETFEVLTFEVVKDKNKVLYQARNLKTEAQDATDDFRFLELKGAHAPSFKVIDFHNFEDKNTFWSITQEGQEVTERKDVE